MAFLVPRASALLLLPPPLVALAPRGPPPSTGPPGVSPSRPAGERGQRTKTDHVALKKKELYILLHGSKVPAPLVYLWQ